MPDKKPADPITEQLKQWGEMSGSDADAEVLNLVYAELHRQAHRYLQRERPGHVLQTTALVHEAYLKLSKQRSFGWENRSQFYGIAATVMRRILIDFARSKHRQRRGGPNEDIPIDNAVTIAVSDNRFDLLELNGALVLLGGRGDDDGGEREESIGRAAGKHQAAGSHVKTQGRALRWCRLAIIGFPFVLLIHVSSNVVFIDEVKGLTVEARDSPPRCF